MQPPLYARVLAKIGAGRGQLISESKIKALAESKGLSELVAQLRDTSYQDQVSKVPPPLTSRKLERAFNETLIETYIKIIQNSPKKVRPFLSLYLVRFEVENIKALIKAANAQLPAEQKLAKIYLSVEDYLKHREVTEEAVKAQNIAQVVAAFKGLNYKYALNMGLKSYEENASTACLDVFIDRFFYEQQIETYENLPKKEQKYAYYYVSLESDSFTLLTLLRGKALDYDPNWLRLTVPKKNFNLRTSTVESLVSAVDFESALKIAFATHYAKFFTRAQTPEDTIGNAEKAFKKALCQHAQASVVTDNFDVGAPLSYMNQKEVEAHNLSVLSLGVEAQMKPEDIRSQLLL